jgi:hypothetical protein
MIASSNEKKPCWFCNLGADQMCLKPRRGEEEQTRTLYTCNGHRLLRFHISGSLVRGIAALRNHTKG